MNKKIILSVLFLAAIAVTSCKNSENKTDAATGDSLNTETAAPSDSSTQRSMYVCPMHPEETSDKPAKCSKCGMDLELKS